MQVPQRGEREVSRPPIELLQALRGVDRPGVEAAFRVAREDVRPVELTRVPAAVTNPDQDFPFPALALFDHVCIVAYNAIIDCRAWSASMASITIRNLDAQTKARLRVRAAHHSRSMEEEARNILRAALADAATTPRNLAEAIRARFQPLGGIELRSPAREPMRVPPRPGK
jgi:plasmid stability protein